MNKTTQKIAAEIPDHRIGNKNNYKHGFKGHKLYGVWNNMNRRCYEEGHADYPDYGARGILVCPEWRKDVGEFCEWALQNGWEEGLQIDRINNNVGYSPDNCRFVTCAENNLNKRLIQKNNSTGYRGVYVNSGVGKPFKAGVKHNKKQYGLGYFDSAIEAAFERDKYVIKHKLGMQLNFLEDSLPGRQLADVIEDWLYNKSIWDTSTISTKKNTSNHQWRLDRIGYCLNKLTESA